MYLDYAERQVKLGKIISMQEWKEKLEVFLKINEYNILKDNGKMSAVVNGQAYQISGKRSHPNFHP